MTPYEKHLEQIRHITRSLVLEEYVETMAFDDDITHTEYTDLYGIALDRYRYLVDIETTAQSLQGEYVNAKEEGLI